MSLPVSQTAALLAQSWLAALWQGLLLVGAVAAVFRLFPGWSAGRRSLVWLAVFALLVMMHLLPLFTPLSPGTTTPSTAWHVDLRWAIAFASLWLAVSTYRLVQLLSGLVGVHRMARSAVPVSLPAEVAANLASGIEVFSSSSVTRPCVVGSFHPRILLPASLARQLSPAELHQVLLHETEHIRRGDPWANLLQKSMLALFPLSPALLLVERRLCMERELACDDRVLHTTGARKAYAACLARLAEHRMLGHGTALVLGAWDRRPALIRRVERILRTPAAEWTGWRARASVAAMLVAAVGSAGMLLRFPAPVRFSFQGQTSSVAQTAAVTPTGQAVSYGHLQMVKAVLPATTPKALRKARHVHVRRAAAKPPAVLMASYPVPPSSRTRSVEVAWQPPPGSNVQDEPLVVPAVFYVVSTPQGWMVFEL